MSRYYETCTNTLPSGHMEDVDLSRAYWCPAAHAVANGTLEWKGNMTADPASFGMCTENAQPPDNGCEDHYEPVGALFENTNLEIWNG